MKNKLTLQRKLIFVFVFSSLIVLAVNLFMFININGVISKVDEVYTSNVILNEMTDTLQDVQNYMTEYMNTKSTDAIENYYRCEQDYREQMSNLNDRASSDEMLLMEKNIRNLSESYLECTEETIQAKRGRIIEKYKVSYENASNLYSYISTYLYTLNNERFKYNSENYNVLLLSFKSLEVVSLSILVVVTIANVILAIFLTRSITSPLSTLAAAANEVGRGNLDVGKINVISNDEIGVVANAFNQMIVSIRGYIEKIRQSMEIESAMKEKELMMETHLKDAQLKYLQAQINPHFLFNTLNAGAQLAMMEEADKTYDFIQNMAAFFRYNIKKDRDVTTLRDEIQLVDNYIYILNVRFSGEIHFEKEIEEEYLSTQVPSMIIQPLVENAINYGVRNINWEGRISLEIKGQAERILISVADNGMGMTEERIQEVLQGQVKTNQTEADSNGVGLGNVISRLRLMYGVEDVMDILSEGPGKGTEVIIYIPKDKE